jgi:predicted nucleic acid-binding protein
MGVGNAALVIDASVALAWALPDEASIYAEAALAAVEKGTVYVPELWPYEIANGLVIAYRRQRITFEDEQLFLDALSRLDIHMERSDALTVIRQGTFAANRFVLTAYDAAYVDLARKTGLPLATLDERMRVAAVQAGVAIFQP